jgi:Xaa-Pro aminopeptidase
MIDDNVRSYITQSLMGLGVTVVPISPEVSALRERKSEAEIKILRAVFDVFQPGSNGR